MTANSSPIPAIHFFQEPFTSPQEALEGDFLTDANLRKLRNKISSLTAEVYEILLQDGKELEYANRMSYLRGQLLAYKDIFEAHYESVASSSSYSTQGPLGPITNLNQL